MRTITKRTIPRVHKYFSTIGKPSEERGIYQVRSQKKKLTLAASFTSALDKVHY